MKFPPALKDGKGQCQNPKNPLKLPIPIRHGSDSSVAP